MRIQPIALGMALVLAGVATSSRSAERPRVLKESMTIQSHRVVPNNARTAEHPARYVSREMPVHVTVYRPNDGLKHPALVYLHGGGMSFADPVMDRFHTELANRGLVVLAPHYLLDGTGWPHWHESAVNTVTLATSLRSVDPSRIGMAGLSMGGQIGLSTAARDPRIKAVAEFFTAWPGTLPDEPIDKLPPVLLLNGTADPVIPFNLAMVLDEILKEHRLPFERHVYERLGHGFRTLAAFQDGVNRTASFFGGRIDHSETSPAEFESLLLTDSPAGLTETFFDLGDEDEDEFIGWPSLTANPTTSAISVRKKKRKRVVARKPVIGQADSSGSKSATP